MKNIKKFWNLFCFLFVNYAKGGLVGFAIGIPLCVIAAIFLMIFKVF